MSIVRIGLSEDKGFSEGYASIFGKKTKAEKKTEAAKDKSTKSAAKKTKKSKK